MIKTSTLIRVAAVGLAVTAFAACTPRRPVDTGAGETVPPASNDQYTDSSAGAPVPGSYSKAGGRGLTYGDLTP